jgi:hypothetical protein
LSAAVVDDDDGDDMAMADLIAWRSSVPNDVLDHVDVADAVDDDDAAVSDANDVDVDVSDDDDGGGGDGDEATSVSSDLAVAVRRLYSSSSRCDANLSCAYSIDRSIKS